MARHKKACEFCQDESFWWEDGANGHALHLEFYPGHLISISSFADNENGEPDELRASISFAYCPNCGRALDV